VGPGRTWAAVVDTVKVAVALDPLTVAVDGTEQVISTVVEESAQLRFTVPLKPFRELIVTVVEPPCPALETVMLFGFDDMK